MEHTTFEGNLYAGGAISNKNERAVYFKITADLHESHSAHQSAVEAIYTDALLSGAGKYTREEFMDAVNLLGASIGVNIYDSKLHISLRTIQENAPKLLQLFQTMMTQPTFASKEIERIKVQTKNLLAEHKENARALSHEYFKNSLYGKKNRHYTNTPEAISKEIDSISAADLKKLHNKTLTTHWTVTIGANKNTVSNILHSIDICKKGKAQTVKHTIQEPKPLKSEVVLHDIPSKQNIEFSIGSSLPFTLHDAEYLPFLFGLNVLGKWGGFTGRLMSTVREKEGLTYSIYARTESVGAVEKGHWRIMTFFAPDKAVQGLNSTLREIQKIQKSGITQDEFDRFKVILKTQQVMLADSLINSVDTFHSYLCEGFTLVEIEEYRKQLMDVTRKGVNEVLKKYLHPDKLVISGAGPVSGVKKELLSVLK